jgi:membrane-bound metal-dependent hydrolase YbcI (DUF457 family)
MRAGSHKLFNTAVAANVLSFCYRGHTLESIILAIGLCLFSSFPDSIEDIFRLKHRGKSHALEIYGGVALLCWIGIEFYSSLYWIWFVFFGMTAGSILHIVADMFSVRGVDVFDYRVRFGLYSTGTKSEYIFLWSFIALNAFIFFR